MGLRVRRARRALEVGRVARRGKLLRVLREVGVVVALLDFGLIGRIDDDTPARWGCCCSRSPRTAPTTSPT